MATSDSHPETGYARGAAFADAGDLQPLVEKIHKIAQDLDELQGLIAQKRQYVLRQLSGITLLSRKEVAQQLAMSVSQVDRATRKGELTRIKIDSKPRFALLDVLAYVDSRRASGPRRSLKSDPARPRHGHHKT